MTNALVQEPSGIAPVVRHGKPYYRKITETVLRWYLEYEDGIIQLDNGPVFDARLLDYRLDVEGVMGKFDAREAQVVLLIHRDGYTQTDAVRLCGFVTDRPWNMVADIEARMGQAFERLGLDRFLEYVGYLR